MTSRHLRDTSLHTSWIVPIQTTLRKSLTRYGLLASTSAPLRDNDHEEDIPLVERDPSMSEDYAPNETKSRRFGIAKVIRKDDADAIARTASVEDDEPIDPEVADKLRRKIDRHILPLMMGMHYQGFQFLRCGG